MRESAALDPLVLDIDIGNTRLKWRLGQQMGFIDSASITRPQLLAAWGELPRPERVRWVSVVCNQAETEVVDFCRQVWQLRPEKAQTQAQQAGVTNSYREFQTMGADRWLAMLAGFNRTFEGCCVVDCGSAVTVDYVAADGRHQGGYIAPGLRLMRKGLLSNTKQIHLPEETSDYYDTRPGRSTAEAVGHGIELMMAALAERVVRDCDALLGDQAELLVTGGDAERFIDAAGRGRLCRDLVLDGLAFALPEPKHRES